MALIESKQSMSRCILKPGWRHRIACIFNKKRDLRMFDILFTIKTEIEMKLNTSDCWKKTNYMKYNIIRNIHVYYLNTVPQNNLIDILYLLSGIL